MANVEQTQTLEWGPSNSYDEGSDCPTDASSSRFFSKGKLDSTLNFLEEKLGFFQCRIGESHVADDIEDLFLTECGRDAGDRSKTGPGSKTSGSTREDRTWVPDKILEEPLFLSDMDTVLSDEFTHMEQGYFNGIYDHICKPVTKSAKQHERTMCPALDEEPNSVTFSFDDTISKLTFEDQEHSYSEAAMTTLDRMREEVAKNRATIAAIVKAQSKGGWRAMAKEEAEAKAAEITKIVGNNESHSIHEEEAEAKAAEITKIVGSNESHSIHEAPENSAAQASVIIVHHIAGGPIQEEEPQFRADFEIKDSLAAQPEMRTEEASVVKEMTSSAEEMQPVIYKTPDEKPVIERETASKRTTSHFVLKPSKSVRKRLLHSFRKLKKNNNSKKEGDDMTEKLLPSSQKEQEETRAASPISEFEPASVTASVTTSNAGSLEVAMTEPTEEEEEQVQEQRREEREYTQVVQVRETVTDVLGDQNSNGMEPTQEAKEIVRLSSMIEELEVLPRRKEPVYTAYLRTPSNSIKEDVEVLRKESLIHQGSSDLSTLKIPTKYRKFIYDTLEPVEEDEKGALGSIMNKGSVGDYDTVEQAEVDEKGVLGSITIPECGVEDGNEQDKVFKFKRFGNANENEWMFVRDDKELPPPLEVQQRATGDDHTDACSSITPSLITMTSLLDKEREETELLRKLLKKKDEDLERLRRILEMNESKAVVKRVNSSLKANPLQ